MTIDEVTRDELQGIITQLKEAIYNHQQWHGSLVRTLVCKLTGDIYDISDAAHTKCRFGQWYYSKATDKLRNHPAFIGLGEAHQRIHHEAKLLLINANADNPISSLDYDNFTNALERLRLEISALERELEDSLFNRDALTGAINRFGILPTLREQQELIKRQSQHCCIAMMDLDNFKVINDLHGHAAGDQVLAASIHYLIKHLRPYDKVFRYGGEEFLLCMPYTELTTTFDRIMELKEGIAALKIDIGGKEPIHIKVSFGLARLDPGIPVEKSIDHTDKALYAAKSAGRNCVQIWNPSM
ncbi:MAG: diguanylate cyclase [Georgfuchsia sp.]